MKLYFSILILVIIVSWIFEVNSKEINEKNNKMTTKTTENNAKKYLYFHSKINPKTKRGRR